MTQEEVAEKLGVDSSTFSRKMKADGLSFTVEQMHKLAEILNMTPQDFFAVKLAFMRVKNEGMYAISLP